MKLAYFAAAAAVALGVGAAWAAATIPANIAAAVANPNRPQADRDRDAVRKPGEVLAFAGVKPGEQVLELISAAAITGCSPGAVGPKGHVTEGSPEPDRRRLTSQAASTVHVASRPQFQQRQRGEVRRSATWPSSVLVDMVWTSQNYHDLYLACFNPGRRGVRQGVVYEALKPGGVFLIEDHAAAAGSSTSTCRTNCTGSTRTSSRRRSRAPASSWMARATSCATAPTITRCWSSIRRSVGRPISSF